jgi:hypothetical protein
MQEAQLDLSIASLTRACQGNVDRLPSFMVHDDDVWPRHAVIRTDSRGRVHMRRSTFNRVVVPELPIRAGLWHRIDLQEMHIDLQPHHLQGSLDSMGGDKRKAAKVVALADEHGRLPGDQGYGERDARDHRQQDVAADVERIARSGSGRGVRSTVFD